MIDEEKLNLLKECQYNVIVNDLLDTVMDLSKQVKNPQIKYDYIKEFLKDKEDFRSYIISKKRLNDLMTLNDKKLDNEEFVIVLGDYTRDIFVNFINLNNPYCKFLRENLSINQYGDFCVIRTRGELNKFNRYKFVEEDVNVHLGKFIKSDSSEKDDVVQTWYRKDGEFVCTQNNYSDGKVIDIVAQTTLF